MPLSRMIDAPSPSTTNHVVFSIAGDRLALPVDAVQRFLPLPRLDRLPTAPAPVEGVFVYHGKVVPVLRLAAILGLPVRDVGLYAPLLLVAREEGFLALLAGRVHGVVPVAPADLLPADPALSFNGCAVAAFRDPLGTVAVLSPDRLLTETEARLLDAFRVAEERRLSAWSATTP